LRRHCSWLFSSRLLPHVARKQLMWNCAVIITRVGLYSQPLCDTECFMLTVETICMPGRLGLNQYTIHSTTPERMIHLTAWLITTSQLRVYQPLCDTESSILTYIAVKTARTPAPRPRPIKVVRTQYTQLHVNEWFTSPLDSLRLRLHIRTSRWRWTIHGCYRACL